VDATDVKFLKKWVSKGGVLLLMANDGPNCEFTHFNQLAEAFGFRFSSKTLNPVINRQWEQAAETNLPNHPLFKGVSKIYMKEVGPITVSKNAKAVLKDGNDIFIAETQFGKGYVLAVGDPWLYNEYIDHWLLPESFENLKAANNMVDLLLQKVAK
jgi:unsaturated rhamnogalacturonyl hydrolase